MADASPDTAKRLLEMTLMLMRSLAHEMRQNRHGLAPVHVGILMRINHGTCSLTELAKHQSVRLPTISKSITLLVKRGWVERKVDDANRRQTLVALTPEGRRVLMSMKRRAERHVERILEPLTSRERAQVEQGLANLSRVLNTGEIDGRCK